MRKWLFLLLHFAQDSSWLLVLWVWNIPLGHCSYSLPFLGFSLSSSTSSPYLSHGPGKTSQCTTAGGWACGKTVLRSPTKVSLTISGFASNAWLHDTTCFRNDINQVGSVAGGSMKCRGYFVNTQVSTLVALSYGFLGFALAALILGKLWSKPILLALYVSSSFFASFTSSLVAFLMWVVYAEQYCQPNNTLFPLKGYSWG